MCYDFIIPGGRFESDNICCDRCNYHIERLIDKEFCDIFAYITSHIDDFRKTNNTKSEPKYSGYALQGDSIVKSEVIKNGKVKESRELIEKEKLKGKERLDTRLKEEKRRMRPFFADFNLDNTIFKQGISKIAYNYAIFKGIQPEKISSCFNVTLGEESKELSDIQFNAKIIPFYPGNDFDDLIELKSDFCLYHYLLLFTYGGTLWCYIDLFGTFQYYVLLQEEYSDSIIERYEILGQDFQYLQKNMDMDASYKEIILEKKNKYGNTNLLGHKFYFLQDKLQSYFRIETPLKLFSDGNFRFILYPLWILQAKEKELINIADYTCAKFNRLAEYLRRNSPTLTEEELAELLKTNPERLPELLFNSFNPPKLKNDVKENSTED